MNEIIELLQSAMKEIDDRNTKTKIAYVIRFLRNCECTEEMTDKQKEETESIVNWIKKIISVEEDL